MWPTIVVCGSEMALTRRSVCAFRSSLRRPWMLATTKSKRSNTSPGQSSERSADVFEACQPARRGGGVLDKTTGFHPLRRDYLPALDDAGRFQVPCVYQFRHVRPIDFHSFFVPGRQMFSNRNHLRFHFGYRTCSRLVQMRGDLGRLAESSTIMDRRNASPTAQGSLVPNRPSLGHTTSKIQFSGFSEMRPLCQLHWKWSLTCARSRSAS